MYGVVFFKEHAGHATDVMRSLDLSAWYGVVIVSGDELIYEVLTKRERKRQIKRYLVGVVLLPEVLFWKDRMGTTRERENQGNEEKRLI